MDVERNIEQQFRVETLDEMAFAAHLTMLKEPLGMIKQEVKNYEAIKQFMSAMAMARGEAASNLRLGELESHNECRRLALKMISIHTV